MTSPLLAADRISGVYTSAPVAQRHAAPGVSGRLGQLACAVAVAPFALLTVLFLGPDSA